MKERGKGGVRGKKSRKGKLLGELFRRLGWISLGMFLSRGGCVKWVCIWRVVLSIFESIAMKSTDKGALQRKCDCRIECAEYLIYLIVNPIFKVLSVKVPLWHLRSA